VTAGAGVLAPAGEPGERVQSVGSHEHVGPAAQRTHVLHAFAAPADPGRQRPAQAGEQVRTRHQEGVGGGQGREHPIVAPHQPALARGRRPGADVLEHADPREDTLGRREQGEGGAQRGLREVLIDQLDLVPGGGEQGRRSCPRDPRAEDTDPQHPSEPSAGITHPGPASPRGRRTPRADGSGRSRRAAP
jgi:hypothetical protein